MIVKYIAGDFLRDNLIQNRNYCVLALRIGVGNAVGILNSFGELCIYPSNEFEIVNSDIPPDWSLFAAENGFIYLQPNEFFEDFWELYEDENDPKTSSALYRAEKKVRIFHQSEEA